MPDALKSYSAQLDIMERLAKTDPGNMNWQHDLLLAYQNVGNVQLAQGHLPEALKSAMKLHFVDQMDEVLKIALQSPLTALVESDAATMAAIPPSELTAGQTARQ